MSSIQKEIFLNASIARVWSFLTDRDKMARWLMVSDFAPESGRAFTFRSEPSGSWDGMIHSEVREVVPERRLSYTWNANDIGAETLVTFELEPAGDGTRLLLTHSGFEGARPGSPGRHAAGWTRCLATLRESLDGPAEGYDWSRFDITYYVDAPLADVFALWSTRDGMQRFWADRVDCNPERSAHQQFANGDRLELLFPTGTETTLEILNIESNRFVLFSFGEDYGWVQVSVADEAGRTRIALSQFGIPTEGNAAWEVHANARGWWICNLVNIASVLRHDRDLRVRTPETSSGPGALFPEHERSGEHDWRGFDIFFSIDAAPEDVITRWRSAAGLASFFIRDATFVDANGAPRGPDDIVEPGDRYTWHFVHDYVLEGEILTSMSRRVAFTFGDMVVNVSAEPAGDGALLHLRQDHIEDTPGARVAGTLNCRCCWMVFVVNLKSMLEYGNDLRDPEPRTADSIAVHWPAG